MYSANTECKKRYIFSIAAPLNESAARSCIANRFILLRRKIPLQVPPTISEMKNAEAAASGPIIGSNQTLTLTIISNVTMAPAN